MSALYLLIALICEGREGRGGEADGGEAEADGGEAEADGGSFRRDRLIGIHSIMSGSMENTQQPGQLLAAVNEDASPWSRL